MRTNMIDQETNLEITCAELSSLIIRNPELIRVILSSSHTIEERYIDTKGSLIPRPETIKKSKKKVCVSANSLTMIETAIDSSIYRISYLHEKELITSSDVLNWMKYLEQVSDSFIEMIEDNENVDIKENIEIYEAFYNFYYDLYEAVDIYLNLAWPELARSEFKKYKAGLFDKELKALKKYIETATDEQITILFQNQTEKRVEDIREKYKSYFSSDEYIHLRVAMSEHDKIVEKAKYENMDEFAQLLFANFFVLIHLPGFVFTSFLNQYYRSYKRMLKFLNMEDVPGSSIMKSKEMDILNKRYITIWLADKYSTGFITLEEAIDIMLNYIKGNHKSRREMCDKRRHISVENRYLQSTGMVETEVIDFKNY